MSGAAASLTTELDSAEPEHLAMPGFCRRPLMALRIVVGTLMLAAIGIMLLGVLLRYVMVPLTAALDLDPINYFWVEEAGELILGWIAFLGAGVAIVERGHFAVPGLVERLPAPLRGFVQRLNLLLCGLFGAALAIEGCKLAVLNAALPSPALGVSMGWGYGAVTIGGGLIVVFALAAMLRAGSVSGRP